MWPSSDECFLMAVWLKRSDALLALKGATGPNEQSSSLVSGEGNSEKLANSAPSQSPFKLSGLKLCIVARPMSTTKRL